MKRILALLALVAVSTALAGTAYGQKKLVPDRPIARGAQKNRPPGPAMLQLIQGFYVNALRQQGKQVELSEDQINRIIPFLRQYLDDRNQINAARRPRSQMLLRQAVMRGAPDEELAKLIQQFDQIDVDARSTQERFFANVDPLLTIRQRGWLRVWQLGVEDRIKRMIQDGAVPAPPTPLSPPRPKDE